jgi:hypothetical protein
MNWKGSEHPVHFQCVLLASEWEGIMIACMGMQKHSLNVSTAFARENLPLHQAFRDLERTCKHII